jgi:methylenetetrahydrofolate dehydrogenase (NADP+)/methenyltetrahydrofolate cyclohydrolase
MNIIDGKALAAKIRLELKEKVEKEKITPGLAVIFVGEDEASKIYVRNKNKACEEVGIKFKEFRLPSNVTREQLIDVIEKANKENEINGILLQSPIPKELDIQEAFGKILPEKDVDGFNPKNIGLLTIGSPNFIPCTPKGIMKMFEEYNIDLQGKKAVILGRSNIVGKPMAQCLLSKNATVTICHSKTEEIEKEIKEADVLIAAIGQAKFVKADMVKEGAVIIDVGMNRDENGKICGDVDFENVSKKTSLITPVPGGVGPMTIAMLLENTIKAYEQQN